MVQENKIQEPATHKNVDNKVLKENKVSTESKFSKEQLLAAKCFENRRDIVDALLVQGKQYTIKEVQQKIENYMKGKVK